MIIDIARAIIMMLQLGASLTIVIRTTLEMSFMLTSITLQENICSTGVTHDDHNMTIEMFYSLGHSKLFI
jgi:hypothetical protein